MYNIPLTLLTPTPEGIALCLNLREQFCEGLMLQVAGFHTRLELGYIWDSRTFNFYQNWPKLAPVIAHSILDRLA